jgi:hypothetical protein
MAFSLDVPPVPPRSTPNPAWRASELPSSGSRRLAWTLAVGVLVAGVLGGGAYVIIGRRGAEAPLPQVAAPADIPAPAPSGTGVSAQPAAPAPVVQPAEPPPLRNPPATVIDGSLEATLSTEQKVEYGFPKEWTIRRRVITPETGSAYVTFEVLSK